MKKTVFNMLGLIAGVLFAAQVSAAPYNKNEEKCEVPSTAVRISVKQEGNIYPVYTFTVTNLYNSPVYYVSIGWGPQGGLDVHVPDEYIPIEVISPEGWIGPSNYRIDPGETMFHHYRWFLPWSNKQGLPIKPGETLSGFKLVMLEPLDYFKSAPFRVKFSRGFTEPLVCVYGTVVFEE